MKYLSLLLCGLLLGGCAGASPRISAQYQLEPTGLKVGMADLAWSPDGNILAVAGESPHLVDASGQKKTRLGRSPIVFLAWSPDGSRLAAVRHAGAGHQVVRMDAQGEEDVTLNLPGRATGIVWSDSSTLVWAAVELSHFSFGSNLKTLLYTWKKGVDQPERLEIADTTASKELAAFLEGALATGLRTVRESPWHDDFALGVFVDPPAFDPYIGFSLRRYDGSGTGPTLKVGLAAPVVAFSRDGESLWVMQNGKLNRIDRWSGEQIQDLPAGGPRFATSPFSDHFWDGSQLRDGDAVLGELAAEQVEFAPRGGRAAVVSGGELLILAGLPVSTSPPQGETLDKLRKLRAWRARDLVSPEEYQTLKQKLWTP